MLKNIELKVTSIISCYDIFFKFNNIWYFHNLSDFISLCIQMLLP